MGRTPTYINLHLHCLYQLTRGVMSNEESGCLFSMVSPQEMAVPSHCYGCGVQHKNYKNHVISRGVADLLDSL